MKNFIKILFWQCVLLFFSEAYCQTYYEAYKDISKHSNTLNESLEFKVDSLMTLAKSNKDFFSYREIAHRYGIYLIKKKKVPDAIHYVLLEIEDFERNNVISEKYTNALYVAGRFYFYNSQYDKAIKFYEKVISINNIIVRTGQSYCEIGRCYDQMRDFHKATSFYEKGIEILKNEKQTKSIILQSINYVNLLRNINTTSSLEKSFKVLKTTDSLAEHTKISLKNRLSLLDGLARQYEVKMNYDFKKAIYYYNQELNLASTDKDTISLARIYNNIAYLYNIDKRHNTDFFVKSGLNYANYPEAKARLYDNLTDYQIRKNQPQKALKSIHKSLEFITKSEIKNIPSNYQINQSILKDYTLYCLKKKAEIYLRLYHQNEEKKHLKNAIKNIESAEYVVNLLLNGTSEASTQLIWRREASQAYLYGAYAAHLLGDEEQAFSFMEKNKALLLSESILKNTEFANLPRNVSDEETRLQKLMYELENKLSKKENNAVLQDSLFNAKRQHEKYVDSLKIVYPKYFDRKIDVAQVPLSKVKEELKKDQVLVSYIWNKFDEDTELLIGLATSKEKAITFEINQTDSLKKKIARYRALISQPQNTKEGQEAYQKVAYELYQELFPSQEVKNLIKRKNLIIIPDGDLQNIPFEALITKENSNDYFILNGDVNYSYSYSFLKHNDKVKRETNQSFIGYSPVSFKEGLSSLNDSEKEVETITKELGGVSKFNKQASKEDFLKQSSKSKIIHLATHADAGENPWIAFSDEKLELHELYTYKNNAELVTLSACNTSLGEMAKGEGVLSLARGFFHSGSKSVVSSLWNVNDTSTSDIMTDFYKNLKEGQTKSEALNNAKRTYLTTHELSAQSPYYWSSFVLIGDAEAIYESHNYWLYTLVILGFLALFIFFRKKRIS